MCYGYVILLKAVPCPHSLLFLYDSWERWKLWQIENLPIETSSQLFSASNYLICQNSNSVQLAFQLPNRHYKSRLFCVTTWVLLLATHSDSLNLYRHMFFVRYSSGWGRKGETTSTEVGYLYSGKPNDQAELERVEGGFILKGRFVEANLSKER